MFVLVVALARRRGCFRKFQPAGRPVYELSDLGSGGGFVAVWHV